MRRSLLVLAWLVTAAPITTSVACAGEPAPAAVDDRMEWWREARFGLFIHWGLYAVPAGKWGGNTNYGEWIMHSAQIPIEEYEKLVPRFDPVEFDADQWCRIARAAGMRYVVITSKHHDGFCLFDSALTDYDVMATPFRRDIMQELAEACRRHDLRICWYHSIMDWHHPDYLPRRGWETRSAEGADFSRYVEHLRGQVTELLTSYGDIGVMWFDGQWEGTWRHEYGQPLYDLCRSLQPDVIVNNRVDVGRGGVGMTQDTRFAGDFGTPEQEIPATGFPGVDWETCMTMNRHWGWNESDQVWKSSQQLVRMLVDIASKGGNFLLNVGPTAAGTFPEASVERLAAMGRWMDVNGKAIHGTSASPFDTLPFGRCTVRPGDETSILYLHVFDWPDDGVLEIPGLGNRTRKAWLLADRDAAVEVTRTQTAVHLALPGAMPDPVVSVVALEVEGRPVVFQMPRIEAVAALFVRSLEVTLTTDSPSLEIRSTTDGSEPTVDSPRSAGSLVLRETTTVRARTFFEGRAVSETAEATFRKVEPQPAAQPGGNSPGLVQRTYAGTWDGMPNFEVLTAEHETAADRIDLGPDPRREHYGLLFTGFLRVPEDRAYRLALTSDDGSRLYVDGRLVVDNDGLHGAERLEGSIPLAAGDHSIRVEYFNKTGGSELSLEIAPLGGEFQVVGPDMLWH